jgi:hypothetical protein
VISINRLTEEVKEILDSILVMNVLTDNQYFKMQEEQSGFNSYSFELFRTKKYYESELPFLTITVYCSDSRQTIEAKMENNKFVSHKLKNKFRYSRIGDHTYFTIKNPNDLHEFLEVFAKSSKEYYNYW